MNGSRPRETLSQEASRVTYSGETNPLVSKNDKLCGTRRSNAPACCALVTAMARGLAPSDGTVEIIVCGTGGGDLRSGGFAWIRLSRADHVEGLIPQTGRSSRIESPSAHAVIVPPGIVLDHLCLGDATMRRQGSNVKLWTSLQAD